MDIVPIEYLLKKIENFCKNRKPLTITTNPNIGYRGFNGFMGNMGCEMLLSLDINFANNTEKKINATINNIDFYPKKEIKFFKFKFEKGIHSMGFSFLKRKIPLDPGDTLFRFPFEIKSITSFTREDFEGCKDIPTIFKIEYTVSPKFQEKTREIELKDFFEKMDNLGRKNVPAWQWRNF